MRLLGVYSGGRYDLWALAGSVRGGCRAHVMSELVGRRVPIAKAGITALREAFYTACGVVGQCEAEREERFQRIALDWPGFRPAEDLGSSSDRRGR